MCPRYPGRELADFDWFPQFLRDGLADFLAFFSVFSGLREKAYREIARMIEETNEDRIVELCAGSGFGGLRMLRRLAALVRRPALKLLLTDLRQSREWPKIQALGGDSLSSRAVEALQALREEKGVFVMFASLHHLPPREVVELVRTAADCGKSFVSIDYFQRGRLTDLLPLFLGPPLMVLTAPLVFPFSLKRIALTWLIPVLPALLFVDTALTMLRSYRVDELKAMVDAVDLPQGMRASARELTMCAGLIRMTCLEVCFPVRAASHSLPCSEAVPGAAKVTSADGTIRRRR